MNIFYLDESPKQCAEWMVDKHVVKMILETAQLLCTAHRVLDGELRIIPAGPDETGRLRRKRKVWNLDDNRDATLYSATHVNHPSAIWCRESILNYTWLAEHLLALGDEYTHRYGKKHLTIEKLGYTLQSPPLNLRKYEMTKMPSAMDPQYAISDDPITNYRNYYKYGKARMHAWKNRPAPAWI
jgi:hypothetical protein